jgi:hypothetical protein
MSAKEFAVPCQYFDEVKKIVLEKRAQAEKWFGKYALK